MYSVVVAFAGFGDSCIDNFAVSEMLTIYLKVKFSLMVKGSHGQRLQLLIFLLKLYYSVHQNVMMPGTVLTKILI